MDAMPPTPPLTIRYDATDRTGMTLEDLEAFTTAARNQGHADDTRLKARIGIRGQLRYLESHHDSQSP